MNLKLKLKPKFVEVKKGENVVILTEEEYERILDILDAVETKRILSDESDPVLKWDDVHGELVENRIAEARKSRGITQKELAERLGLKPSNISRMEKNMPEPEMLKKIAKTLKCRMDDLI